jgi:hypothetical protein
MGVFTTISCTYGDALLGFAQQFCTKLNIRLSKVEYYSVQPNRIGYTQRKCELQCYADQN